MIFDIEDVDWVLIQVFGLIWYNKFEWQACDTEVVDQVPIQLAILSEAFQAALSHASILFIDFQKDLDKVSKLNSVEKWHSFEFTTFISADPDFDPRLNFGGAIVALPVKAALCALSTRISIVAGSCILNNSITVNELFENSVGAVVLKCHNHRVAVILNLLVVLQKGTLAKF